MSSPSDQEKKLITKFRSRVFDILKPGEDRSDQFLIRWIRAQDGHLEKAELMLRKVYLELDSKTPKRRLLQSFHWRSENAVDGILSKELHPLLTQHYKYNLSSVDKLGHPVLEILIGQWDMGRLVNENLEKEFIEHTTQLYERVMERIREGNEGKKPWEHQNTQFTAIVDWEGFSLLQFKGTQLFLRFAGMFEPNYPETLFKGFYINCPPGFSQLFSMIKRILPKSARNIKVYGGDRGEWGAKLKRLIYLNQLSKRHGGTREE